MQNVQILLAHFCENHGPRIVLTCQPLHGKPARWKEVQDGMLPINPYERPQFYGDSTMNEIIDRDPRCAACSSFGSGLGMVSNDHATKTSYLSTQLPINEKVFRIAKETCLRALSVEISTPLFVETKASTSEAFLKPPKPSYTVKKVKYRVIRETNNEEHPGVVLYGDQENGFTLSYTFKLSDSKARGFKRLYAFLAITPDKLLLLNRYNFFLKSFSSIIKRLQEMANWTFDLEQSRNASEMPLDNVVKRMVYLPQNFFPRFSPDTSRSLTAIVNNDDIFHLLHKQIVCLFMVQTNTIKDVVLEGVPTQDMLIAVERDPESLEESDLITSLTNMGTKFHIRNLQLISWRLLEIDQRYLMFMIWTVVVGDQLIVKSDDAAARKFFLLAVAHLLPVGCVRIVSNAANYANQYKNNFVGCSMNTAIPLQSHENSFIVTLEPIDPSETKNDLDSFKIDVLHYSKRCPPMPRLISRYTELLADKKTPPNVIEAALKSTRYDWLNKAKIVFQLSRQREKINLDRVIQIIKCEPQDSAVLLFLQAGLSRHYRQVVFNTIKSSKRPIKNRKNNGIVFKKPR